MKDKFTKNYVYKIFAALVTLALIFTMGCVAVFAEDEIPKTDVTYTLTYPDGTTVTQNEKGSALTYDDVQKLLKTENWRKMATGLLSGSDGIVNLDPSWTKGTIRIVETKVPAGYTQGEESEKTAKLEDGSTTFVNPREDDSTTSGGTKTGDGSKLTLYILTGGVAAAIFAFLAFKKKKVRAGIISMMLIGVFAIGSVYAADGFVINKIDDNGDPVEGAVFDVYGKPEVTWEENISVTLTKTWDDDSNRDAIRPAAGDYAQYLTLKADGTAVSEAPTITDNGNNTYTVTWSGLDKNKAGAAISYTVDESEITGYTAGTVGGNAATGFTITNTHTPETTTISGTKTWPDDETPKMGWTIPSSIDVTLQKKDDTWKDVETKTVSKDAATGRWTYDFGQQPKYNNGTEIEYRVVEKPVAGYKASGGTKADSYNLTNEYDIRTLTLTKTWAGDSTAPSGTRPNSFTFPLYLQLYKNAAQWDMNAPSPEVVDNGDNTYTVTYVVPRADENGTEYEYKIEETDIPNYTEGEITGDMEKGFAVTNTYEAPVPSTITLYGKKTWDFGNSSQSDWPTEFTFTAKPQQLVDGAWTDVSGVTAFTVTYDTENNTFNPPPAEEETSAAILQTEQYSWTLPKYESDGETLIEYRVAEVVPEQVARLFPQQTTSPVRQADGNIEHNLENKFSGGSTDGFNISISMSYENGSWADWWGSEIGWGGIVKGNQTVTITNADTSKSTILTFTPVKGGGKSAAQTVQLEAGTYTISQGAYTAEGLDASVDGADSFTEMYLMRTIDQTITIDSSGKCTLSTSGNHPGDSFHAQYYYGTKKYNPETGDDDIPVFEPSPTLDQTGHTGEHTGSCVVSGDSITLKSVLAYGDLELEDV